jgi:hypothetical protein
VVDYIDGSEEKRGEGSLRGNEAYGRGTKYTGATKVRQHPLRWKALSILNGKIDNNTSNGTYSVWTLVEYAFSPETRPVQRSMLICGLEALYVYIHNDVLPHGLCHSIRETQRIQGV